MTTTWNFPTRIVFGVGALAQADSELRRLIGDKARILTVTDPGVAKAGLAQRAEDALTNAGFSVERFEGVSTNPTDDEVEAAAHAYSKARAKAVVAIGGGAALDVAKLVRVRAKLTGPLERFSGDDGPQLIREALAPMIALPTTAGTGSEVGRAAVVTSTRKNIKLVIFSPSLMPDVAILDPELTVSLPAQVTAATGFDALTHSIEAYCARGDHPMADAIALSGIRHVTESLRRAVQQPEDVKARGNMMKAALMGAVAFQKGLGACHALAHALGALKGTHHGLANALFLPAVIDFNRSHVTSRIADIARAMGVRGDDEDTLAFECSGAIRALRRDTGLDEGLSNITISDDDVSAIAACALEDSVVVENPRTCSADDLMMICKASRP